MRQKMAKILCVCISKERKTCSQNIHECEADLQGLVGDVHYGMGGRKQVSLLPYEKVKEYFEQSEEEFRYGRFGENLLVEGIDWNSIAEGTDFVVEMYFWKQSGSVRAVLHQMLIREKRYARPWNPGLYSVRFWRQGG